MKLTRSTGYALASLAYMAQSGKHRPIPAKEIAKYHQMPLEYLLKVLLHLVHAGILLSIRGPQGGFMLARGAGEISLLEIVESVEGTIKGETGLFPAQADTELNIRLAEVYQRATRQAAEVLTKTSLAVLLAGKKRTEKKQV